MAVSSLSKDVISTYLSRDCEEEADFLGTDLIVKAGYNAYGYGSALERLESTRVFTKELLAEKKAKYQKTVTILSSDKIPDKGMKLLACLGINEVCTRILKALGE